MKLFEDKERTYKGTMKHSEKIYDFYDRSAREDMSMVRENLNTWFDNYPEKEKSELKIRLQTSFSNPFYELFIHELFFRQGFELFPHPDIKGTNKKPDFLVKGNEMEFYLEAKEATDQSIEEEGEEKLLSTLYDQINQANLPDFFLHIVDVKLLSKEQPKSRAIVDFIEKEAAKYDSDILAERVNKYGWRVMNDIEYSSDKIKMIFRFIPKPKKIKGKSGGAIGIWSFDTKWIGHDYLKRAFKKKATRYGELDRPYLICINDKNKYGSEERTIMQALFGSEQVRFINGFNDTGNISYSRKPDGIFFNKYGINYSRVSAVLVTSVDEISFPVKEHWLVENPYANHRLNFDAIELSKIILGDNQMEEVSGKDVGGIFKMTSNWFREI